MGHWTPTGIEPTDDDDDEYSTTILLRYLFMQLIYYINTFNKMTHKHMQYNTL